MKRRKITKYIWHENKKWIVLDVKEVKTKSVFEEKYFRVQLLSDRRVEKLLSTKFDAPSFYPDTKEIRVLMKKLKEIKDKESKIYSELFWHDYTD